MQLFLLAILGIVIYLIYLLIEFALPIVLVFIIINHPQNTTVWTCIVLLVLWFMARMTVYIIKETRKDE